MSDTIAAVSTALGNSGIGIVRISGDGAVALADQIFRSPGGVCLADCAGYTVHYGHAVDEDGRTVDEVLATLMRAPHSYTTEDTVELSCHGGVYVVKKVLALALKAGARLAEPGEFTKRAFLGGRVDLSQAEAVMDLIRSENDYALEASVSQLNGAVSEKIKSLRSSILYQTAFIESALDDPEHYSLDGYSGTILPELRRWQTEIAGLIESFEDGRRMTEGIRTAIVGKPNVGKSSILNCISGTERAIVTEVPGTTRDVLEQDITLSGLSLKLLDTAGIRRTDDPVESIGVDRALQSADSADLVLYVLDVSDGIDEEDVRIAQSVVDKPVIILLNKEDLLTSNGQAEAFTAEMNEKLPSSFADKPVILFSAVRRTGLDRLKSLVEEMFISDRIRYNDQVVITNVRHRNMLDLAQKSLSLVEESIMNQMPEDFYTIDLMDAYTDLGQIIGEEVSDDLVNEIFSRFCMGK